MHQRRLYRSEVCKPAVNKVERVLERAKVGNRVRVTSRRRQDPEPVRSLPTVQAVVALAAIEDVIASATIEEVVASAAIKDVVAAVAINVVVACTAGEYVVAIGDNR